MGSDPRVKNMRSKGTDLIPQMDPKLYSLLFTKWRGVKIHNSYRKPLINYKGKPLYAELAVLRLMEKKGWKGVWVDNWGSGKFLIGMPDQSEPVELLGYPKKIFDKIVQRNKARRSGCWDLFLWKGKLIRCMELKRLGSSDRVRPNQKHWYQSAIAVGLRPDQFTLVEWDFE